MIEVFAGTAVFASVVVLYVVFGTRRRGTGVMDRAGANAVLFADRRRELIAEGRVQALDTSTVAELEEELALDLIEAGDPEEDSPAGPPTEVSTEANRESQPDAPQEANAGPTGVPASEDVERPRPPPRIVALTAVAMAATAVGLYAIWGEPYAPDLARAGEVLAGDGLDAAALARAEKALAARALRDSEDANTWFLLGHARMRLADYGGAEHAFATLRDLTGPNEEIDAVWAQASYLAAGGLSAATRAVVQRVLAARPDHPAMLEMLAMDAMRRGAFAEAAGYLARATAQPLPDSRRELLTHLMAVARSQVDSAPPLIAEVSLDAAFDVAPAATVFLIARDAESPQPPLAVKRLSAGDLPARVELTDADAMLPGRGLTGVETLELVARVALGGSAAAAAGDIESETWIGQPSAEPVRLHLDRQLP